MKHATVATVLLLSWDRLAFAHPGHGDTEPTGWQHYLTEPVHVLALASFVVVAVGTFAWRRSRRRSRS